MASPWTGLLVAFHDLILGCLDDEALEQVAKASIGLFRVVAALKNSISWSSWSCEENAADLLAGVDTIQAQVLAKLQQTVIHGPNDPQSNHPTTTTALEEEEQEEENSWVVHCSLQRRRRQRHRQRGAALVSSSGHSSWHPPRGLNTLANQLVLVASGIRTVCLVDWTCYDLQQMTHWLQQLTRQWPAQFQWVHALVAHGNLFLVNLRLVLRQQLVLCLEIESIIQWISSRPKDPARRMALWRILESELAMVNVSSELKDPQLLSLQQHQEDYMDLTSSMYSICCQLLACHHAHTSSLVLDPTSTSASSTAIAGMLLGYPIVYANSSPTTTSRASSRINTNCLSMRPLWLLQISCQRVHEPQRVVVMLSEFSIPQSLVTFAALQRLQKRWELRAMRRLQARAGGPVTDVVIHVDISSHTMDRVAI